MELGGNCGFILKVWPTPIPRGKVTAFPNFLAFQSTRMFGVIWICQAPGSMRTRTY